MQQAYYDVAIIGAGVSGCAIARELSRLDARVCVIEAEDDVCCGTSRANSAIVHAGFDTQPGTLMARLNVEGTSLMPDLCQELDVDFSAIGSLVVCTDEKTCLTSTPFWSADSQTVSPTCASLGEKSF